MIKQDDELDKLEEDIRRLKNQYDLFFSAIIKVPPSFMRHQVESYIHEISKQKMRDNSRRFRFNTVLSRYNQFREMWARRMREREEGPLDFRRRQAAMAEPEPPVRAHPVPPPVTSPSADPYVKMTPGANGEQIRKLYEAVERANVELGKPSHVSLDQLAAMVQKQTELVRSRYNVHTVAFRVETVDGKVKLKAKPLHD
ncbi:MAG: MXAN_5187 C-terminal domain-containing protein [Acidobacteriota bacterium]